MSDHKKIKAMFSKKFENFSDDFTKFFNLRHVLDIINTVNKMRARDDNNKKYINDMLALCDNKFLNDLLYQVKELNLAFLALAPILSSKKTANANSLFEKLSENTSTILGSITEIKNNTRGHHTGNLFAAFKNQSEYLKLLDLKKKHENESGRLEDLVLTSEIEKQLLNESELETADDINNHLYNIEACLYELSGYITNQYNDIKTLADFNKDDGKGYSS